MRKSLFIAFCYFIALSFLTVKALGAEFLIKDLTRSDNKQNSWIALPYAFSSDSMGFTVGAVGLWHGFLQPQVSIVSTVFVGENLEINHGGNAISETNRTKGAMVAINGYRSSFANRLFISGIAAYTYYPNQRLYVNGSNDSVKDLKKNNDNSLTPLQTQGNSNWFFADFRYVLPWGESKSKVLPLIILRRGIAVNRENIGNGEPFVTGQTIVGTELFYAKKTADKFVEEPELNTNGTRFYLAHDNTDYPTNPSRGYRFKGNLSIDYGLGASNQRWNAIDFEYSHFIELPNFSWSKQSVIALSSWSAYSPSWDKSKSFRGHIDLHQPPMWEGARLGGYTRMRSYDNNRFNDKAAIYGTVEYRIIPIINPLSDQQWNPIPIDWFQFVLFAEAGRVANKYDLPELLSHMKYDAGFSLRVLAAKIPIRLDMGFGEEGSNMRFMVNQPF